MACFHAQQCAEKYLKGYLVAHGVTFRFGHDLGYLIGLCAGIDPAFADLRPAAVTLSPYVGTARYPSEDRPRAGRPSGRKGHCGRRTNRRRGPELAPRPLATNH